MTDTTTSDDQAGIITKERSGSVAEAVHDLVDLVDQHGMKVFTIVDHSGEARGHGLTLRDTNVVIFGSPVAGTPVMEAAPLAALDLPLKVLIWDDNGQTRISYTDPDVLARRYRLSDDLASRLAGIGPLTDALVG
jgi:uncharacterized protein (DUF302 family)